MASLVPTPSKSTAPVPAAQAETVPSQYLTFTLGGEMFAVGILCVKEIIEYGSLTEIPMMPSFIRGVINLRGAVVPVIDLAARFGGRPTEIGKRTCIVIVEIGESDPNGEPGESSAGAHHDIGIIVDAVSEVLDIPAGEIEPPPTFGARIRADFIFGMGKVAGKFVIILNIDRVLSVDEIALLAASDGAAASPGVPGAPGALSGDN